MRLVFSQRPVKSQSIKSRIALTACLIAVFVAFASAASPGFTCGFVAPDRSTQVKLDLAPGVDAAIEVSVYEPKTKANPNAKSDCYAYTSLPLSAFPSTSSRYGTSEVAAAIREQLDGWELGECSITVYYENDTGVDLANHELCVNAAYAFEKGGFWSSDREAYCWEPVEPESL